MSNSLVPEEYKPLSEIVFSVNTKITFGKDPNLPYVGLENIPSRASQLLSWETADSSVSTNAVFSAGDVLFGKLRPNLRKCVAAPFAGYCSTDVLVLRAIDGVEPDFALRVLQSERIGAAAERSAIGTKMPRTAWEHLNGVVVFCPEAAEQKVVASALDSLDTAIHQTEAIVEKLKQVKQGLLHDLLTRGVDANGELRPSYEKAPHLYKQSPVGWIPQEWDAVTLGVCCLKIADRDHTTPQYVESGVLMISPTNLHSDEGIDFSNAKHISGKAHETNRKKTDLEPGDIVIHRIGAGLGRVRLIRPDMPEFSILHSMAQIRPNPKAMTSKFMLWAMRTESTKNQIGLGTQSIGVPDLGLDKISKFLIAKPPLKEQELVAQRLNALQERIDADATVFTKLTILKSGLIGDLLTGRVRVTPLLEGLPR